MDRKAIFLEQDDRVLKRNVVLPKIVVKMSEIDNSSLSSSQTQIIECLHCGNLAIDPKCCMRCNQFVCRKCCGDETKFAKCPSCLDDLKDLK